LSFCAGLAHREAIMYDRADWALRRAFVERLQGRPDTGVLVVENARLEGRQSCLGSSFLEHFLTESTPPLYAVGAGDPQPFRGRLVLGISTNFGNLSEDLLNRSLPVHLAPKGNIADRCPDIGNPKHVFLPRNRDRIVGELVGMVERWKKAKRPL